MFTTSVQLTNVRSVVTHTHYIHLLCTQVYTYWFALCVINCSTHRIIHSELHDECFGLHRTLSGSAMLETISNFWCSLLHLTPSLTLPWECISESIPRLVNCRIHWSQNPQNRNDDMFENNGIGWLPCECGNLKQLAMPCECNLDHFCHLSPISKQNSCNLHYSGWSGGQCNGY